MHHIISPVFSSCPTSPTAPPLPLRSHPPCLPLPSPPPPAPSHPLGQSPPVPTTSEKKQAPGLRTDLLQRCRIGGIEIYCANVLYLFRMYTPISSKPASYIAAARGGYYQLPSSSILGRLPVIRCTTLR